MSNIALPPSVGINVNRFRQLRTWLLSVVLALVVAIPVALLVLSPVPAQAQSQPSGQALAWSGPTGWSGTWMPTLYVVGDPKMVATALSGVSRIIHPANSSGTPTGADSSLLAAVRTGLLISLFFACVAYFTKGKINIFGWAGMVFLGWAMFIQTSPVMVQSYFTYGGGTVSNGVLNSNGTPGGGVQSIGGAAKFIIVQDVPLGFALPAGISGAISSALSDMFVQSFSTVNSDSTSGLQFADPLRQLLKMRTINPCTVDSVCQSLYSYGRYCSVWTTPENTTFSVNMANLVKSPQALQDYLCNLYPGSSCGVASSSNAMPSAGSTNGGTMYYPYNPSESASLQALGVPMACSEAGPRIYEDINRALGAKALTSQVAAAAGNLDSGTTTTVPPVTQNTLLSDQLAMIGRMNPQVAAANALIVDPARFISNFIFWKVAAEGYSNMGGPAATASLQANAAIGEAVERWRVDGAAEGSVFLRGMFASMNVLLFVLIGMTPIVFVLAMAMLSEGIKIIKEYVIAIIWAQSWFPTAVVINYYITSATADKLFSTGLQNPLEIFAPINHPVFYDEIATMLGSAGWMMGAVPVITYALLRGSVQGMVSMASKAAGTGGSNYLDDTKLTPSLETASNAKGSVEGAIGAGATPASLGGGGAGALPSSMVNGGGQTVTAKTGSGQADAAAISASNALTAASSLTQTAARSAAAAYMQDFSTGASAGSTLAAINRATTQAGSGTKSSSGLSLDQSRAIGSIAKTSAGMGASGADFMAAAMGLAAAAGAARGNPAAMNKALSAFTGRANGIANMPANAAMKANILGAAGTVAGMFRAGGELSGVDEAKTTSGLKAAFAEEQSFATGNDASLSKSNNAGQDQTAKTGNSVTRANSQVVAAMQAETSARENSERATRTANQSREAGASASLSSQDVGAAVQAFSGQPNLSPDSLNSAPAGVAAQLAMQGVSPTDVANANNAYQGAVAARAASLSAQHPNVPKAAIQQQAHVQASAAMANGPGASPTERAFGAAMFGEIASRTGNSGISATGGVLRDAAIANASSGAAAQRAGNEAQRERGESPGLSPIPGGGNPMFDNTAAAIAATQATVTQGQTQVNAAAGAPMAAYNAAAASLTGEKPVAPEGAQPRLTEMNRTFNSGGGAGGQEPPKASGSPAPTELPASNFTPPTTAPSALEVSKADNRGLTPALASLVRGITSKRPDVQPYVAEAIAKSAQGQPQAISNGLANRILQAPGNLAALSAANVKGIGNVAALPPQTQGELAVFMDRLGAQAIPLLQGRLTPATARSELNRLLGSSEVSDKFAARFNGDAQAALLTYAAASSAALAAGRAAPAIGGRTPGAVEAEVTGFLDRVVSPLSLAGGAGVISVLATEAAYFGSAALTGTKLGQVGPVPDGSVVQAPGWGGGASTQGTVQLPPAPQEQVAPPSGPSLVTAGQALVAAGKRATTGVGSAGVPVAQVPTVTPSQPRAPGSHGGLNPAGVQARSMPVDAQVTAAAARTGVPQIMLQRLIAAESGGDTSARNPRSSATGAAQFIESTWLGMAVTSGTYLNTLAVNRGLVSKDAKGRSSVVDGKAGDLLALRTDLRASVESAADYARQNINALRAAKIDGVDVPSLSEVALAKYAYVMHVAGATDGISILRTGAVSAGGDARARYLLGEQVGQNSTRFAGYLAKAEGNANRAFSNFLEEHTNRYFGGAPKTAG